MKKTIIIALFAIAIVGCKKEVSPSPSISTSSDGSLNKQAESLIHDADINLYNEIYNRTPNGRAPIVSTKIIPGIFYIPASGIDNATCWPAYNVCMILVSSAKSVEGTTPPEISVVQGSISETYDEDVTTKLIVNKFPYEVKEIKSFSATKMPTGEFSIRYKQ